MSSYLFRLFRFFSIHESLSPVFGSCKFYSLRQHFKIDNSTMKKATISNSKGNSTLNGKIISSKTSNDWKTTDIFLNSLYEILFIVKNYYSSQIKTSKFVIMYV